MSKLLADHGQRFDESYQDENGITRTVLGRLSDWARSVEARGGVTLWSWWNDETGVHTLLPRFDDENAGLVTIWNDGGLPLSLNRSVIERRCPPEALKRLEQLVGGTIGQGSRHDTFADPALLDALSAACADAARKA